MKGNGKFKFREHPTHHSNKMLQRENSCFSIKKISDCWRFSTWNPEITFRLGLFLKR